MAEKIKLPEWQPDFGPAERHPPQVRWQWEHACRWWPITSTSIRRVWRLRTHCQKIRFIGGGLRYCKAMGVELKDRGITGIHQHDRLYPHGAYRAFELVRIEARRYGVSIVGSEIMVSYLWKR